MSITTTIHRTRFEGLGYTNQCKGLWRIVDLHEGLDKAAVVGEQYKTKVELLANLSDYAVSVWGY